MTTHNSSSSTHWQGFELYSQRIPWGSLFFVIMSSPTMSVSGDELLSETQLQKVYLMLDDEEVTDKLGFAE